jgi:hypothetical protein
MWETMCEWPNPYPRQPSRSSLGSRCSGWGGSPSGGSNPYPQACTACEAPEGAVLRPIPGRGWASCIRLAAQGLGPGCGLHERVADPKAKAVRVGCSSSPARTPSVAPLHLLVCMWWGARSRPCDLIPKGSTMYPWESRAGFVGEPCRNPYQCGLHRTG